MEPEQQLEAREGRQHMHADFSLSWQSGTDSLYVAAGQLGNWTVSRQCSSVKLMHVWSLPFQNAQCPTRSAPIGGTRTRLRRPRDRDGK